MSKSQKTSDRAGRAETLRVDQNLTTTGEGVSVIVEDVSDDDINLSDGRCNKQTCRDSLKTKKRKKKLRSKDINIGTWNVRTMRTDGKLDLLLKELEDYKINITGLCETRWKGEGVFNKEAHTIIFSGSEKGGERGVAIILDQHHSKCLLSHNAVSERMVTIKLNTKTAPLNIIQVYAPTSESEEEEVEQFYTDLQNIKNKIPSREMCIIMGDFNAKIGQGEDKECGIGPHGLGERNERGDMLASFCQTNNLTVTNTLFQHRNSRKYTWVSPGERHRNQIDYILIDTAWKTTITNSRARPAVDCESDHIFVWANLRMKAYRNSRKTTPHLKFDLDKLQNSEYRDRYAVETRNRFTVLLDDWQANERMPDEMWAEISKIYKESADKTIGRKKGKPSKPYITDEVFQLAKQKSKARKEHKWEQYKSLKSEIRAKIRRDKIKWLEEECAKITEANAERKSKKFFQQIKKVKGAFPQVQGISQSLNNKDGNTLTEMKDILKRWYEYGQQLFQTDIEKPTEPLDLNYEDVEPLPLLHEVTTAINQLKCGKSPGLDGIPAELIQSSETYGIKALHLLCNKIWETCQWPEEWKRQEFVMLKKSGSAKECSNYRTIALISHTSKILLIVILNRMRAKIEEELSDCQAGYRSNRGTVDMLFTLQLLIEKVRNSVEEAFLTFIDYSKAFDSVKHHRLFNFMMTMGFPKHLVALIAGLYNNQKATIRWNGEHCEYFNISKGVRQGCILSPHLFSLYTEQIMRNADTGDMGIKIGGRILTDLRYADDTVLAAGDITSSRRVLNRINSSGNVEGMGLNAKKTKVMHIKGKDSLPDDFTEIVVNKTNLEKVQHFKYLGSFKSSDGTCLKDVMTRIAMAKAKMIQLNNIWKDRSIAISLKLKMLKCLILPVLMYGCEAWTLRKKEEDKLKAAEMWLYRQLLSIRWQDKRTNKSVLLELGIERSLMNDINKRRLRYIGHAIRSQKTDLMSTALMGRVEGCRKRGRPAMSLIDNITSNTGLSLGDVVHRSRDREGWRAVVTSIRGATIEHGDADE